MKIKLITPRMSLRPMDSEYKRMLSPSIAPLMLAALTPPEHEVVLEDENAHPLRFDDRPDLVGITVNVDTSRRAYEIAAEYRARRVPVILGGIYPSSCPEEVLQHADSVCIGEAEELWPRILDDAAQGGLKRTYYNTAPTDLARTPRPKWEMLNRSSYLYTNIVCTSRGCAFRCDFCYNSCEYVHNCYRNRPVEHVVEEIKRLGTRQVMFIDDNFIGDPAWTRRFVRAIMPLGLTWHCAVSANIGLHPDLMDLMAESGCRSLFIGFESINGASISTVHKRQNRVEEYDRVIAEIHARGMMVNASMVFGFDNDTTDVFPHTVDWLVRNKVETMTAHILTPYPGTVLHRRLLHEGRIFDFDPTHYNTAHVVYHPKQMTADELYRGYLWMYAQVYSLKNIVRRLPLDTRQWLPYLFFNFGYRKFGYVTSWVARLGLMHAIGQLARRLAYGITLSRHLRILPGG
ncbi:MAG: B12-binding domain-containing radical SAM protein [Verrucomicrobia bacterium]|nr:B12-binding domain-containing radical SAM protein [Verrucomicrobiota bacterium]